MTKDRFDQEAAEWDNNPITVQSSKAAFAALTERITELKKETPALEVLEIGCGTGLLTLLIAPTCKHITAVDTSTGMISALRAKLAKHTTLNNVTSVEVLLEDADDPRIRQNPDKPQRFDLVLSHLVLHHIPDLPQVLTLMYNTLKPGGMIALTDFENAGPHSRAFHPESKMEGVERHGIEQKDIRSLIEKAGFDNVQVDQAFELEKDVETGGTQMFPFLLMQGTKPQ